MSVRPGADRTGMSTETASCDHDETRATCEAHKPLSGSRCALVLVQEPAETRLDGATQFLEVLCFAGPVAGSRQARDDSRLERTLAPKQGLEGHYAMEALVAIGPPVVPA